MDAKKLAAFGLIGFAVYMAMKGQEDDVPPPPYQGQGIPNYTPSWGDPMMNPDAYGSRPPAPVDEMPDRSAYKNFLRSYLSRDLLAPTQGGVRFKKDPLAIQNLVSTTQFIAINAKPKVDWDALVQRQVEYYKKNPRHLRDVLGTSLIKASALKSMIDSGHPAVFFMPYSLEEANGMTSMQSGRVAVAIDTWEAFRFFADMMMICIMNAGTKQEQNFLPIVKFFNYNDWFIDMEGEVYQGMMAQLGKYLCASDPRIHSNWWKIQSYPSAFTPEWHEQCDPYVEAVKDRIYKTLNDGLMMLFEYASMKFSSLAFAVQFNPDLGKKFGDSLTASITQAVTMAATGAAIGIGLMPAASVPVVGWITAAVGVLVAALSTIFAGVEMQERNRKVRGQIANDMQGILSKWFKRGTIKEEFSGYVMGVVIPSQYPFDDYKDDLWQHTSMSESIWPRVAPQLPYYYLNPDFDLVCSLTIPMQKLLVIRPVRNRATGLIENWEQIEIDPKDSMSQLNIGAKK